MAERADIDTTTRYVFGENPAPSAGTGFSFQIWSISPKPSNSIIDKPRLKASGYQELVHASETYVQRRDRQDSKLSGSFEFLVEEQVSDPLSELKVSPDEREHNSSVSLGGDSHSLYAISLMTGLDWNKILVMPLELCTEKGDLGASRSRYRSRT